MGQLRYTRAKANARGEAELAQFRDVGYLPEFVLGTGEGLEARRRLPECGRYHISQLAQRRFFTGPDVDDARVGRDFSQKQESLYHIVHVNEIPGLAVGIS